MPSRRLRSIAWEGRYLVVGFPAGIPKLPLNLTLLKSCDVRGVFWGAFAARDPKANAAHIETLFRLWREGKIAPEGQPHLAARAGRRGDRPHGGEEGGRQARGDDGLNASPRKAGRGTKLSLVEG